jgi:hypothetical protein
MASPADRSPTVTTGRGAKAARSAGASRGLASARKGRVNRYRWIACTVAWFVLALAAWAPTARAATLSASSVVHASTCGAGGCAPRAGRILARDQVRVGTRLQHRHATSGVPARGRPVHPGSEHHAALPAPARAHHHAPTLRVGHVLPVSAVLPSATAIAARLGALPDDSCSIRAGRVTSGRGPPRARRSASLPSTSLPGSLPAPQPATTPAGSPRPSRPAAPTAMAVPRLRAGTRAVPCPGFPDAAPRRTHVSRPEGAVACLTTPSNGEAP